MFVKLNKEISECYKFKQPTYMFSFYMKKAESYLKDGDQFSAFMAYQIAFNLQTKYPQHADDIITILVNILNILKDLKWKDEFDMWLQETFIYLDKIQNPLDVDYNEKKKCWSDKIKLIQLESESSFEEGEDYIREVEKNMEQYINKIKKINPLLKDEDIHKLKQEFLFVSSKKNYSGSLVCKNVVIPNIDELKEKYNTKKTKILQTRHSGRGTFASVNIKKNEVIYEEKKPVLAYYINKRCSRCGKFSQESKCPKCKRTFSSVMICPTCEGKQKLVSKFNACRSCGELFCSPECHSLAWKEYHSFECKIFGKNLTKIREKVESNKSPSVLCVPLFLKFFGMIVNSSKINKYPDVNPIQIEPFKDLYYSDYSKYYFVNQKIREIMNEGEITGNTLFQHYVNFIVFLTKSSPVSKICTYPYFDFDVYMRYTSIIMKNLVCFEEEDLLLFEKPCFLNHSCCPNAKIIKKDEDEPGSIQLIALKPIGKNEEIKIAYIDPKIGYQFREQTLSNYGFICRCKKCIEERNNNNVVVTDTKHKNGGVTKKK